MASPGAARPWSFGRAVAGYVWDAPRPRAALLLAHGFGEYAERYVDGYHRLIPALQDLGIRVFAFDLEGHGRSPGRRAITDVGRAVEDHLAARRILERVPLPLFLFGHSLGGLVTATSVLRRPEGVRGVVLSSPPLQVSVHPVMRLVARALAVLAPAMPVNKLPAEGLSRIPDEVARYQADPLIHHGSMCARLAASIVTTAHRNWSRYGEWSLPTLVIHGTADSLTEPEGSRRFVQAVASEDRTLHLVEGGYHELLNDLEADETLRVLVGWLERRLVV